MESFEEEFESYLNLNLQDDGGALALFAIEALANFLEKMEDNPALDEIALSPIKFISQSDSIISIWRVFASIESPEQLQTEDFITIAIAVVDFGGDFSLKNNENTMFVASFITNENIEDFVQYEIVPFLRELKEQGKVNTNCRKNAYLGSESE